MTRSLRHTALAAALVVLSVSISGWAMAQSLTREMVEAHVKEVFAAYNSNNVEQIVKADPAAIGFGYRVRDARPADPSSWSDALKAFFARAEYYRLELEDVQTDVDGNIGLAWGFYTEEFKLKDQSPEKVRARFTYTYNYDQGTWRTLLYHRDIQKFDERGRYVAGQ